MKLKKKSDRKKYFFRIEKDFQKKVEFFFQIFKIFKITTKNLIFEKIEIFDFFENEIFCRDFEKSENLKKKSQLFFENQKNHRESTREVDLYFRKQIIEKIYFFRDTFLC